jgi:glutamate--cysteine ligase
VFLLHCLTTKSPPDTPEEIRANSRNAQLVAERGREPGLRLRQGPRRVGLRAWARRLLAECAPIALALDGACGGHAHAAALDAANRSVADPATLPSARVLATIRDDHRGSYVSFALAQSRQHAAALRSETLPPEAATRLEALARESVEKQRRLEAADTVSFEAFLQQYLALTSIAA